MHHAEAKQLCTDVLSVVASGGKGVLEKCIIAMSQHTSVATTLLPWHLDLIALRMMLFLLVYIFLWKLSWNSPTNVSPPPPALSCHLLKLRSISTSSRIGTGLKRDQQCHFLNGRRKDVVATKTKFLP
jgi:hypothetical protein